MKLRTCVSPEGRFVYGVHRPDYRVRNLREHDDLTALGILNDGTTLSNQQNFPTGDVTVKQADWVYEIANPLPFRGTTYISKSWADEKAKNPAAIALPSPPETSMTASLMEVLGVKRPSSVQIDEAFRTLPHTVLLALAATSSDPDDLVRLAHLSCEFVLDNKTSRPLGLSFLKDGGRTRPIILNHELFEVVVNNIHLPDDYKDAMVLRPGVQGGSEIVGEYRDAAHNTHVFEYMRRNSYIPWGHYASNMADDAVRYRTADLSAADIKGLRHLYYQRTFVRMAEVMGITPPASRKTLPLDELEALRIKVLAALEAKPHPRLDFTATIWGWNYGFDYAPSGVNLHASHQQIHQQFALLTPKVPAWHDGKTQANADIPSYSCGDPVADFCKAYKAETGKQFFESYLSAIRANKRMDGRDGANSLIVYEDDHVILFAPKAQVSQWELQLMTLHKVGNILEADTPTRKSIDTAMLVAHKILAALGARMVTSIEYPKRFDEPSHAQRLLYAFLPKLPYAMGAFTEAQLRWICGHFPEDFAAACRTKLPEVKKELSL